jgi:hypothetical protein
MRLREEKQYRAGESRAYTIDTLFLDNAASKFTVDIFC